MIIISPAKNLNIVPEKLSVESSRPFFNNDTNSLVEKLKTLKFDKLKNLMKISDSLTQLNFQRFQDFNAYDNIFKPAVFLFSGDTFNGLSIRSYSKEMLLLAQDRLRIISGLYGLLRPLDLIQPYRLEMGTKIEPLLETSSIAALTYVALLNETSNFKPSGRVFLTSIIFFCISFDSSTVEAPLFA